MLQESIKKGNIFIINKTEGESMWPLVSKGDKIFIRYKEFKDLKLGDIILYEDTEFILHRINKINDKKLITKGDNNKKIDSFLVEEKNYLGILQKVEKERMSFTIKEPFLSIYYQYILPFHPIIKIILRYDKRK